MADASTISAFQGLTGLGQSAVVSLFREYFAPSEELDFHVAIIKALASGILTQNNARIASMIHITDLGRERATTLLAFCDDDAPYDLNLAIIEARKRGEISFEVAATAQMRALTNLPLSKAHDLLEQTSPKGYLEAAIANAQSSGEITPETAATAILKVLSGVSDSVAVQLLMGYNNVEQAIVKGKNIFKDPLRFALARLRARFQLREEDARQFLIRSTVNGDFDAACREVAIDRVMDKVNVDRTDTKNYLQRTKGNVVEAVKLAQENQLLQPLYGGLNADTRNPPDVQKNTHIIGVLGVCDVGHQRHASPRRDGWMVSDFYLWISVLEGMGKSQDWLTCENPHALLSKYGSEAKELDYTDDDDVLARPNISWKDGYLHGDPFEERVVVLSHDNVQAMARRITLSNHGTSLRDAFLRRIEDTCRQAEAADEPVLLMGFCHGDDGETAMGGLCLGIDPGTQHEQDFLSPKLLAESLAKTPNVRISLYLTSCFSGNWVITPQLKLFTPTVMTAEQPHEESYAWEASSSQRHAGGVYTSAFLKELHKEPIDLPDDVAADDACSYKQLCSAITNEANRLWVQLGGSTPMFTPDGGHDKFWQRTGFSLADYKKNYDRLEKVPPSDPNPFKDRKRNVDDITQEEFQQWQLRNPEDNDQDFGSRTGSYGRTRRGMASSLTYLANRYMASHPGLKNASSNTALHDDIEMFRAGRFSGKPDDIERVRSQVLYRTWMMKSANNYRKWMNLNKVTVIEQWDESRPGPALGLAKENLAMVKGSGLFSRPDVAQGSWGQVWQKPFMYLAYAFAASGFGPSDIPKRLYMLKQTQHKIMTFRIFSYAQMPTAQRSVHQMSELLTKSWGRSTQREKHRSLQEAGMMPAAS